LFLPEADASALFARIVADARVQHDPEGVASAVRLCGRLPLAIRVAAARLRDRRTWTVGHLVERLAEESRRRQLLAYGERDVMTAIKVSYRYLDDLRQRVFRLLSVLPCADFTAEAVAAATAIDQITADGVLESLLDNNPLRQDTASRYYFHDLVSDCAQDLSAEFDDPKAAAGAIERLLEHYVTATETWCADLRREGDIHDADHPPGRSERESAERVGAEYGNIAALVQHASEAGEHRHAWRLACAAQPYLQLTSYDGPAMDILSRAHASAATCGNRAGESRVLGHLLAACLMRGATDEAAEYLDRAKQLNDGDIRPRIADAVDQGSLHHSRSDLRATAAFRRADELAERTGGLDLRTMSARRRAPDARGHGRGMPPESGR
jgi:uncharacterized damage-inducible protein DinB